MTAGPFTESAEAALGLRKLSFQSFANQAGFALSGADGGGL